MEHKKPNVTIKTNQVFYLTLLMHYYCEIIIFFTNKSKKQLKSIG
jgi:hypothetical protein